MAADIEPKRVIRCILLIATAALTLSAGASAEPASSSNPSPSSVQTFPSPQAQTVPSPSAEAVAPTKTAVEDPVLNLVRSKLSALPSATEEHERTDQIALVAFYADRHGEGLWVTASGLKPEGKALAGEIANAGAYALDVSAFKVPTLVNGSLTSTDTEVLADAEIAYSKAALLYARYARGGRIPEPAEMLSTELDRRPQWIEPKVVLAALAQTHEPDAYLRSLEPQHPQFEKLRQLYVSMLPTDGRAKPLSPTAKRIRANMEMWRWMWPNMGDLYVFNNIPEFMQYVYKDGKIIRSAKIVAGMLDKQSSIFSRPLKYVVLRPAWRVPESIKVNELWPSLLRGGGLMRQFGLQLQTKDGKALNWRTINWTKADIRDYEVMQPPGPRSVLGHVKFSFPSQHTIFMHDTPDKWMFRAAQRTLSHGCLRVDKPMELAEIVLKDDKDWDRAKIAELDRSGPLNNEVPITKEIPIHLVYFTAWVDDNGKLKTFRDVYGHEKRVTQALDGQWDRIDKGRDHLAPVEPGFNPEAVSARAQRADDDAYGPPPDNRRGANATVGDIISNALGINF